MKKKILVIDDSALMRRVLCDIINSDERFEVADIATDGIDGFKKIVSREYDAVVLDVYMPRMTGIEMLREMKKSGVKANVLMASTTTGEGAKETMDALELGAVDFIKKPENVAYARHNEFKERFLDILGVVTESGGVSTHKPSVTSESNEKKQAFVSRYDVNFHHKGESNVDISKDYNVSLRKHSSVSGKKIVAIASSTGGPKALQQVIPLLPAEIDAPVMLVQHMPKGFTASLSERLNDLSKVTVSEAKEGDVLEKGHVYVAPGGSHMKAKKDGNSYKITLTDEPNREGVKPCANYMYESLIDSDFDEVTCVVLTGMGADGTAGIKALNEKKKTFIVSQDQASSTVYGMPKAIAATGLVNSVVPLDNVADQIIKNVGVR